jgi:hypothetical protein
MPVLLFWAIPAVIVVGGVGHYLVNIAELINALVLANPTKGPSDRRRNFRVIEGGRT